MNIIALLGKDGMICKGLSMINPVIAGVTTTIVVATECYNAYNGFVEKDIKRKENDTKKKELKYREEKINKLNIYINELDSLYDDIIIRSRSGRLFTEKELINTITISELYKTRILLLMSELGIKDERTEKIIDLQISTFKTELNLFRISKDIDNYSEI